MEDRLFNVAFTVVLVVGAVVGMLDLFVWCYEVWWCGSGTVRRGEVRQMPDKTIPRHLLPHHTCLKSPTMP